MFWVYYLINRDTNKTYVGVTEQNPVQRYCTHYICNKRAVGEDLRRLGFDGFDFRIVQVFGTRDEAYDMEAFIINKWKDEKKDMYNEHPGMKVPSKEFSIPVYTIPIHIEQSIRDYIRENMDASYEKICERFGWVKVENPLYTEVFNIMQKTKYSKETQVRYASVANRAMKDNGYTTIEAFKAGGCNWFQELEPAKRRPLQVLYETLILTDK